METKSFATRAEWKKADNPKKEGKHIIGLDLGYSGAKGFYENGYFCIPNFSAPITEDLFGSLHDGDTLYGLVLWCTITIFLLHISPDIDTRFSVLFLPTIALPWYFRKNN